MNKKFLFGLLASVAMVGCSDNNGLDDKENGLDGQKGTDAYLTVNIMDASSLTRATGGDPDSLVNGIHAEHEVVSADFYFYDKNGIYVSKANVWRDGKENENHGDVNKNIEYLGESVVVLKGLKDNTFPNYMVTVLNAPTGFTPGATLDEMEKVLTYASLEEGASCYKNQEGKFIMATTSYKHSDSKVNFPDYFVTELEDTYFNPEPINDLNNVVEVFVERLAAKVVLKVDNTNLSPVEGKDNVYEIEWTIAGENNKDESSTSGDNAEASEEGVGDAGTTDVDPGVGAEKLHVHFLGWGLNATTKNSYMMKNIDNWTITSLGFAWNSTDFKRSYWGKSYNYNSNDDEYLNYISYDNLNNSIYPTKDENKPDFEYCAENTNTETVLQQDGVFASRVTSILLKAMITDSKDNSLDLVSYRGVLYEKHSYLNYVLSCIKRESRLNAYCKVDENKYAQIDSAYVTLVGKGDGKVKVQLKEDVTLYYYDETKEETDKFVTMSSKELNELNATLAGFNDSSNEETVRFEAVAYTGGMMYYNIPIEHLNDNNAYRTSHKAEDLKEANYGIVRNHLYEVTINSLKNPGHGVFDPNEVIIPKDEKDDELYYVGAKINILSWKIVKQNVAL